MKEKIGMHCFVSGRVQGVFFRASTCEQAKKLGLNGWVRNLSDGRVELEAYGSSDKIAELYDWLQKGPLMAKVESVTRKELPWMEVIDFKKI